MLTAENSKPKQKVYRHVVIRRVSHKPKQQTLDLSINASAKFSSGQTERTYDVQKKTTPEKTETQRNSSGQTRKRPASSSVFQSNSNTHKRSLIKYKEGEAEFPIQMRPTINHLGENLYHKKKLQLIKNFVKDLFEFSIQTCKIHCYKQELQKTVNAVITGKEAPLSPCCNATVIVMFTEDSGGKTLCSNRNCIIRTIQNFSISCELRKGIFKNSSARLSLDTQRTKKSFRKTYLTDLANPSKESINYIHSKSLSMDCPSLNIRTLRAPKNSIPFSMNPLQEVLTRVKQSRVA